MIKTVQKVIVLTTMMVLGATFVFAQQSNTDIATFGQFGTDVDKFFHVNDWSKLEFNGFFGYSRFGANIPAGVLDMGVAAKAGSLYLALYYNGRVIGLQDGDSVITKVNLKQTDTAGKEKTESISLNAKNKTDPKATYGAMVGVKNLGIQFTLEDDLDVDGTPIGATNTNTETWTGSITPKFAIGLPGKLYRIVLGVPIVYDHTEAATVGTNPLTGGGTVNFTTTTNNGTILDADGNYVQIDLLLKLGGFNIKFSDLYLDNELQFNIYGVPGRDINGKETMYMGVANVTTTYSPFKDLAGSGYTPNEYTYRYDNRFWLKDTITPSFDLVNGTKDKFSYIANFSMPISFEFTNHALNFKAERAYINPGDLYGKTIEVKDYYKRSDFDLGISPEVDVGFQFKPADIISLQAGLGLNLFTWGLSAKTETEVKEPDPANPLSKAYLSAQYAGVLGSYSGDSSITTFKFDYPDLRFALGFTLFFKTVASLDFVYLNRFNPSLAGLVYKAVGEGLGSGDTSVVLTIKF